MTNKDYKNELKELIDLFVNNVYKVTKTFPKEEMFGVTSQLRRAVVSIILNYIEGYARNNNKINKQFLRYSYGSLKESEYLIILSSRENYLSKINFEILSKQADRIGGILWGLITKN